MFDVRPPYATDEEREAERQRAMQRQGQDPTMLEQQEGEVLIPRDPYIAPREGETESSDKIDLFNGKKLEAKDAPVSVEVAARHRVLIDAMEEEGERQAEERQQAQIDDDYYHHMQWTPEQAQVLARRGQAPLVFNESRATIDWLCGTEIIAPFSHTVNET